MTTKLDRPLKREILIDDKAYTLTIDADGKPSTQYRLPGEAGYADPRGIDTRRNPDLPPDLVGQEKSPIFNDAVQ